MIKTGGDKDDSDDSKPDCSEQIGVGYDIGNDVAEQKQRESDINFFHICLRKKLWFSVIGVADCSDRIERIGS